MKAPMKLEAIGLNEVDTYLDSNEWVAEQKMDGARGMIHLSSDGTAEWVTTGGGPLKFAAAKQHFEKIEEALRKALAEYDDYDVILDGEVMVAEAQFRIFDTPYLVVNSALLADEETGYINRKVALLDALYRLPKSEGAAVCVQTIVEPSDKRRLFEALRDGGMEGLVFKDVAAPYEWGVRSKRNLKVKFTHTADVFVIGRSTEPNSAQIAVNNGDEQKAIGSVNMNGKGEVNVGDVIEVEFLYWTGEALVQPRMLRKRDDKPATDCLIGQFAPYTREAVSLS